MTFGTSKPPLHIPDALTAVAEPLVHYRDLRPERSAPPSSRSGGWSGNVLEVPMKIAIINQPQDSIVAGEEQRGSVAIVNWELAKRLAERHEVTVYAPQASGQSATERWNTIQIRRVPFVAKT